MKNTSKKMINAADTMQSYFNNELWETSDEYFALCEREQQAKKEKKEMQDYTMRLYYAALCIHFVLFVVFWLTKITIMAYFNLGGVVFFTVVSLIQKRRMKNGTFTEYGFCEILSAIEIFAHQTVGMICLGDDVGLQYYILFVGIVVALQAKTTVKKSAKIISSVCVSLALVAAELCSRLTEPLYTVSPPFKEIAYVLITTLAMCLIFSFLYKQWGMNERNKERVEELLNEKENKIYRMQEKVIWNFADIVERRDGDTGGHVKRTSAYVEALTKALVEKQQYKDILTRDYAKMIVSAAPLHDIGKISVSDTILCKKGKLTTEEFETMKTHSVVGGNMLEELLCDLESDEYVTLARDISKYHHEKWNGKGYPEGLKAEEIPLAARIMAVVDVFDALTSVRAYKDKFSIDESYKIIVDETSEHFDPVIVETFIEIKPQITEIYNSLSTE